MKVFGQAVALPALLLLSGCTLFYHPEELRGINRSHLPQLQPGMLKEQVLQIMGTEGKSQCNSSLFMICTSKELVNNPYRTSGFNHENKNYEILYYWTDVKRRDDVITDDELTPLLFENGKLIGWGQELVSATIKTYEIRMR